jgi:ADP-heptose:LPS heptosyltransferase
MLTTVGLMKLATLVVGGDTGTLHPAVAMGKRVVTVVNSTSPGAAPFGHPDWAVTPRDSQAMAAIEVAAVIEACASAPTAIRGGLSPASRTA